LIKNLPNKLPITLKYLHCYDNHITKLPTNLPISLIVLRCEDNQITHLPINLPTSLEELHCENNQLTKLPLNLPATLCTLVCNGNKYLHIPKKYAKRFALSETPNYNQKASIIQRIWKAKKCKQIMINMINGSPWLNNNVLFGCFQSYGDMNIACTSASRCTRRTGSQLFALLKKLDNNNICE